MDKKYRNLELRRSDIESLSWKTIVFPIATFVMKNGESHSFMIFNKGRFLKIYNGSFQNGDKLQNPE